MRKRNRAKQLHLGGFALVITLIMVVLLTIMAVAFLTSSSLDQATARAFANRANAELAARTAVNTAIARLTDNFSTYNDSATTWEKVNQTGGAVQYQGTTLYYRDQSPDATAGVPATMRALPLISGAKAVAIPTAPQTLAARQANLRLALPTDGSAALDDTNSYDLNHTRTATDTQGTIGAPVGASRPEFRAQWINQTDADGKATSRYAYWIEDESFKANVNLMGITPRGAATAGDNPSQIVMQGLFKAVGVSGYDAAATAVFNSRALFPSSVFFEYLALDQAAPSKIADTSKFESTILSGASNLSRTGTKRINLNKVVATSTVATAIRQQLDEIINAIKFQSPNFGQRFYRTGTDKNSLDVVAADQTIYLNKIAANIRDYIDTDSQPTVVNNDSPNYTVRIGAAPTHCFLPSGGGTAGPNEVIAIGKERIPSIQEYALRVRETAFSAKTGTSSSYTISIDHYVEVWNTSNSDIPIASLGPNPFLLIASQPGWDAGGLTDIPAGPTRDLHLPLATATRASDGALLTTFPAGSVTVFTTDPTLLPALTPLTSSVYYTAITPVTLRTYTGSTQLKNSNNYLRLNMIDRTTMTSDYETEIAFGNDLGMLESAWGAGAINSALSVNVDDGTAPSGVGTQKLDATKYHFRGASLKGNLAPSFATTGDPRTNAEQIRFDLNGGSTGNDKTRYFGSGVGDNNVPGTCPSCSTLGAANTNYVNPGIWPDYSSSTPSATDAPAVVANAALTSIGQLGDIFDPVRSAGDATGTDTDGVPLKIRLSRSGGRTLKIGQSDRYDVTTNPLSLWDGTSNSTSREWASWRLTDMFTTTDSVQLDGRININGVGRDSGAALKAALYQYVFQDPQLGGASLSDAAVQLLIDQLTARIVNDGTTAYNGNTYAQFGNTSGPIAERGELSEMPIFNTGSDLTGTAMASTYDRGREELYRRLTALTTTRGNIFTVYAVGQSLIPPPTGSTAPATVTSTSQIKVTFRVDPVWDAGTPSDPFTPAVTPPDPRFKKPDRYAIKVLYAGE